MSPSSVIIGHQLWLGEKNTVALNVSKSTSLINIITSDLEFFVMTPNPALTKFYCRVNLVTGKSLKYGSRPPSIFYSKVRLHN